MVDAHNTKTGMRYSLGSFTALEEAVPVSGIDYKDQAWRGDWWAYDAEKSIDLAVLLHYPRLLSGLSFIGSLETRFSSDRYWIRARGNHGIQC
jgi:hypothetical protein